LIGFSFAAGTLDLWRDGIVDPNPTKTVDDVFTTIHVATVPLMLGAIHGDSPNQTAFFTGTIYEYWIYNRVLTDIEHPYLYNQTKGR